MVRDLGFKPIDREHKLIDREHPVENGLLFIQSILLYTDRERHRKSPNRNLRLMRTEKMLAMNLAFQSGRNDIWRTESLILTASFSSSLAWMLGEKRVGE